MAMALHPDKLRKAQTELDGVVGIDRMPRISDKSSLPYVNALIKETMRWHPALPLSTSPNPGKTECSSLSYELPSDSHVGIARCTSGEGIYEGYTIPKGTIVMLNV